MCGANIERPGVKTVNNFSQKLHFRCFTGFWMRHWRQFNFWEKVSDIFKVSEKVSDVLNVNNQCSNYLNDVFQTALENNIETKGSFLKLKYPFRKTNAGQMALSYIGPTLRSKTPNMLKRTKNLNMFKHNAKEHYLKELKNPNSG